MSANNEQLTLEGEWEHIVNDVERHNARVRLETALLQRRFRRQLNSIVNYVLVAVAVLALNFAGLLNFFVAMPIAIISICIACFFAGRLWGQRHK